MSAQLRVLAIRRAGRQRLLPAGLRFVSGCYVRAATAATSNCNPRAAIYVTFRLCDAAAIRAAATAAAAARTAAAVSVAASDDRQRRRHSHVSTAGTRTYLVSRLSLVSCPSHSPIAVRLAGVRTRMRSAPTVFVRMRSTRRVVSL